jgi:uncharacterized protein (TIGR03067 family)
MRRIAAAALAIGFLMAADDPQNTAARKDLDALRGSWQMENVSRSGEVITREFLDFAKLVVDGQRYTVTLGEQSTAATFKLDPSTKPKQIDFTYTSGPQKGQTIQGIYELEGDTYRMCRGLAPETARPTKFEAPPDSGLLYVVFKRIKAAGESGDAAEAKELEKATGVWKQVAENGPLENPDARLIYRGRNFEGRLGEKVLFTGHAKLDPTQSPKSIDLFFGSGPNAKPILGVYELDEANFRGCLAEPGKERPTSLTPAPESGQRPFAFRRVKNDEGPPGNPDRKAAIQAELKRFEGTWSYASVIVEGNPAPEKEISANRLVLAGDRFTVNSLAETIRGIFAVDPTVKPKTLNVTFGDGPDAGKTVKGIYQLDGDTCSVCIALGDQPRPTEFASKAGSRYALEVLKRQKP